MVSSASSAYAGLASGFVIVVLWGAVLGKVTAWRAWSDFVHRLAGPRSGLRAPLLAAVPAVELLVGLLVLRLPVVGLSAAVGLFGAFALGAHAWRDRLNGSACACFGNLLPTRADARLVPRNLALGFVGLAGAAAYGVAPRSSEAFGLAGAALALGTALLLRRIDRAPVHPIVGPVLGDPADVPGAGDGVTAVVVILAPGCPACEQLAGLVDQVRADLGADSVVTAVVGGSDEARVSMAEAVGPSARLDLDDLMVRWQVPGTPYFVAVDADGKVRGASAAHDVGVARLRDALARPAEPMTPPRRSRRQVLSLSTSWVLAALAGATAGLHGSPSDPRWRLAADPDPNTFHGGCVGFAEYARDTGLYYDKFGGKHPSHHPGTFGYTLVWPEGSSTVKTSADELDRRVLKDIYGICDCPGQPVRYYYGQEQVTQCIVDCPEGLDCFAWQCKWKDAKTCIRAIINVRVEKPPLTITRLKWIPPKSSSKKCMAYAGQQNDDTLRHEQHHVRDVKDVIAELQQEYRGRPVYGCGANEKEAERDLKNKIEDILEKVRRQAVKREQQRVKDFHDAQSGELVFDCRVCGE